MSDPSPSESQDASAVVGPEVDDDSEIVAEVELVTDGEHLLVIGESPHEVEGFLRSQGLLEKARPFSSKQLAPALRSSAEMASRLSEMASESGLWVKLTPESAQSIKDFGLTDSGVPGVAHAMAGARGSIKKWIQIDTRARAKLSNPAALAGVAGALCQVAREQEAAKLRELLEALDSKLDQVLRGQRDDILGDLAGIEREVRAAMLTREMEGSVDILTWSKLASASMQVRQIQSKAVLKLRGIADDLESHKRVGKLNVELQQTKDEVSMWLSAIARCTTALNELTVLELTHYAAIAPDQVNTKRLSLDAAREADQDEMLDGIASLIRRMDRTAENANQNTILHLRGAPRAVRSIEDTKSVVRAFYDALGIEVDWTNPDSKQWLAAIREWRQWRNAATEAASEAWEKGKPVLGFIAIAAVTALFKKGSRRSLDRLDQPDRSTGHQGCSSLEVRKLRSSCGQFGPYALHAPING